MEALFGATGAEIFLLRETKAERATSEVALGRPSLVGSQRKWEITQETHRVFSSTILCAPPPWACTSASCSIFPRAAGRGYLQRTLIRVGFSQPGKRMIASIVGHGPEMLSEWDGCDGASSRKQQHRRA